jgi:probable rRNA maturation factor
MTVSFASTLSTTSPLPLRREGRTLSRIAHAVLGASYELSVVFIGDVRARRLNTTHRKKDKPTNVLSFPLSKQSGEIYIDLPLCKREARAFGTSVHYHIYYLFVHGLLHLTGLDHGKRMEKEEERLMKKFYRR